MIDSPDSALESAIAIALKNINGVFGNDVFPNRGSAKAGKAYCVYFWAGGGERQLVMQQDMNDFVYSVYSSIFIKQMDKQKNRGNDRRYLRCNY